MGLELGGEVCDNDANLWVICNEVIIEATGPDGISLF